MTRRDFLNAAAVAGAATAAAGCAGLNRRRPVAKERPNIIYILADDLGFGDLGCYGQKAIATPNIDRLAKEGIRFTQHYAGDTVCAPSRSCLMTGQHTGHTRVRGNRGINGQRIPLEPDDITVAEVMKEAGYRTGLIGKWGLGEAGTTGIPTRKGFDYFFGYLNQGHAHNYYPEYLWRNEEKVYTGNVVKYYDPAVPFGGIATKRVVYAPDLFIRETLDFVERNRDIPFFLYWACTIPHANNESMKMGREHGMEVPDFGRYKNKNWPDAEKGYAAMITRLDRDVGSLMAKIKELGLDNKTIVMFSSDNGPHKEGGADPEFFDSNGPLRGWKRDMYEGGIRVPLIARWPGEISPGSVTGHISAFWDMMPTWAELAGVRTPRGVDGISMVPTLLGYDFRQKKHEYLYWEFHEGGGKMAVRAGIYKAVRLNADKDPNGPIELYNLREDLGEQHNIADQHPVIAKRMAHYMEIAQTPSKEWPWQE
ncbi:MAG: arylsulfatase [Candidatus Hydrogenedentes bacterium]|nr:arylsulfatase [Candidatus Hydrogenedentota bacterium]